MAKLAPNCLEFDPKKLILRLRLTLHGDVQAIAPTVERIMGVIRGMKCGTGHEDRIELVLQEALANAVEHGCGSDPEKSVQIWVGCDASRGIIIGVRDPGDGFDPESIPSPLVGESLFADHGRGIYLINQIMDEVKFENDGSEIWMRKHLEPPRQDGD